MQRVSELTAAQGWGGATGEITTLASATKAAARDMTGLKASAPTSLHQDSYMRLVITASTFALAACATPTCPPPATKIETITRTVTVQKPCAAVIPERPAKLTDALPQDAVQLAAVLAEALARYSAPGQWADQAQAALQRCGQP